MPIKDLKYKYDQAILKVYGYGENKKITIIYLDCLRTAGVEDDADLVHSERGAVNDEKLADNIQRTKSKIFELAFCNPWDYFFTGTLDQTKYDRSDLKTFHKNLTQFLRDYNKKHDLQIKYLLIPELHEDRVSWHMHGFIYGLPVSHLDQFKLGDKMGKALAAKVRRGDVVYNWKDYAARFGFCDLEPIKNAEAISKYITKYINKNLATSVTELNANQYYHSLGLKMAETIKMGSVTDRVPPTFQSDHCAVAWLDYDEEKLKELEESFVKIDYYNTRRRK